MAGVALAGCPHPSRPSVNRLVALHLKNPHHLPVPWSESELKIEMLTTLVRLPGLSELVAKTDNRENALSWELVVSTDAEETGMHPFVELVLQRVGPEGDSFIDAAQVCEKINLAPTSKFAAIQWRSCLQQALVPLQRKWQLFQAGIPAIARALSASEPPTILDGLAVAIVTPDRSFVVPISKLLRHQDEEIRDRALGVAVEIGDDRVVKPLLDWAKFGNPRELVKIIDALGRLGGSEAEAFLEFVASGHERPEMRQAANRALEHARNRKHHP